MKKIILFFIAIISSLFSQAQQLRGTQEYANRSDYGGSRYSVINWSVNYKIFEENNSFFIELSNPTVTPTTSSQYGIPGNFYSKSDLGISVWPHTDSKPYNFSLNLIIKYPDGSSHEHNPEINRKNLIDNKNQFKNTNATASSFSVISIEKMMYNGAKDQKLDEIIAEKKAGSSNSKNNIASNNPIIQNKTDIDTPESNSRNYPSTLSNNYKPKYSNDRTVETIGQISDAVSPLISQWANQVQASNEAREQRQMERQEEKERIEAIAAEKKATKLKLVTARKEWFAKIPDGTTPLSYEAKEVSVVYFFVYSYQKNTIESNNPLIYVSNVFSIHKYSDGTWPFKDNVMEDVLKKVKIQDLQLAGYYTDKQNAEEQQQLFLQVTSKYDFDVKNISYVRKQQTETTNDADYWGNSKIKEASETPSKISIQNKKSAPTPKVDFWGNPIKE